MFYVIIFAILAVVLVAGGIAGMSRRRKSLEHADTHHPDSAARRNRKNQRTQSRNSRRKRH